MSNDYVAGDWNAICDRCGFKKKASQLHKEWTGARVCFGCLDIQNPQDFVRPSEDKQRVPWARADDKSSFTETTLNGAVVKDALSIIVTSATGIALYTTLGIVTNHIVQDTSGITGDNVTATGRLIHWTTCTAISGTTITIGAEMPWAAASGRAVYIRHDDRFLDTNEVTVASLG